jgi:hypothetical protein
MTRLLSTVRNLFAGDQNDDNVHFHIGPAGVPAVCDFHNCDRPSLTV